VDLVHRVLATTGLDVELAAAPEQVAAQRRASVSAFADLAAEFRDLDGQVTLGAFLSWLRDAERSDTGPSAPPAADRDAVVIMTVHKAKGLEFPVVALPFLSAGVFPTSQGRGRWPTAADVVPPALCDEPVTDAIAAFPGPDGPRARDHEGFTRESRRLDLLEETRLAYVAVTRAERLLLASGHRWGPVQGSAREPSPYLEAIAAACQAGAGAVDVWCEPPAEGGSNPALAASATVAWPVTPDQEAWRRRAEVAAEVRRLAAGIASGRPAAPTSVRPTPGGQTSPADTGLGAEEAERVRGWDADLPLLLDDLRRDRAAARRRVVALPETLTAAQVMALADDPDRFARDLVRPMPRPPAPAARRGTRFHAWVESRYGQQPLLEPDDLPGAADEGIDSDAALVRLQEAFLRTPYAGLVPEEVEATFSLVLGGRVVRGRIDAVFRHAGRWEVVDWKTGSADAVDPLQLAVYRLAWAERVGVPVTEVDAAFVLVRTGAVVRATDLPDRAALEALLSGAGDLSGAGGLSGAGDQTG
jgi:DNA helicase-2/ATP-dependent DNA helicase PcrA